MAKKQINIVVDTMQNSYSTIGTFKQLDSVFFNVQITEQGIAKDLTGQTLKLYVSKSDKTVVEQKTGITITDAKTGKITIDLLNAALQAEGFVVAELNISDSSGSISTVNFNFRVAPTVANDNFIESTNEIATLKEVELYVIQAKKEIQDFAKLQTEMTTLNESMKINEENRETSETARVEAEKVREARFEEMEGSSALSEITKEVKDARNGKDTLHDELVDLENRMVENVAKQYLEVSTDTGHVKVENTFNGKTKDMVIKGRTLQNLCKPRFASSGNTGNLKITIDGGISTYECIGMGGYITVHSKPTNDFIKPSTIYTLIFNVIDNSNADNYRGITIAGNDDPFFNSQFYRIYHDGNISLSPGIKKIRFTTPTDISNFTGFGFGLPTMPVIGGIFKFGHIMILEGDYADKTIPDYFEGIKSLGEEENKISILSQGKNLCPKDFVQKTISNTLGIDINTNGASNVKRITMAKAILVQGDVTISTKNGFQVLALIAGIDGIINTKGSWGNIIKLKLTEPSYVRVTVKDNAEADMLLMEDMIQIESGTIATAYEVYKEDKKDILLPVQFGCKSLPSGVCDEVMANGDYLQKVERMDLDGSEDFRIYVSQNDTEVFKSNYIRLQLSVENKSLLSVKDLQANSLICNILPSIYAHKWWESQELIAYNCVEDSGIITITLHKSKVPTLDIIGAKNYIQANNIVFCYELAKPILHKAETPTNNNLATFKEITHLSCLNKISPSELKAKFPVDTAATFSRLTRENKNLEEENYLFKNNQSFLASVMLNMLSASVLPAEIEDKDLELLKKLEEISKY